MVYLPYFVCRKCGSTNLYTEVKGNNTGLYCSDCHSWQKWLNKDELKTFKQIESEKSTSDNLKLEFVMDELNNLISFLGRKIDEELTREPLSMLDSTAKSATALAYTKDINALTNIVHGKHWNCLDE